MWQMVASDIEVVFCDESCHLEGDGQPIMLVGCIWTSKRALRRLNSEFAELKEKHHTNGELKWSRVSKSREAFFLEVVDWFFKSDALHFRCVVVADKNKLNHALFNKGSHDKFYYKLYFMLLQRVLQADKKYEVFVDLKDTRGRLMLPHLREVLCSAKHASAMIGNIQNVHSKEVALVQLADFLIGAVAYRNRNLSANDTKKLVVDRIEKNYGKALSTSSSLAEGKFDVFIFNPKDVPEK